MPRFGIWQSLVKFRAINDAKISLSNAITRMYETATLPTCQFPAMVAAAVVRACRRIPGMQIPAMWLGLDDIDAAYRRIPNSQPGFSVFGIWSTKLHQVRFYEVYGHNFGLKSSVVNFNRAPHLVCSFCRRWFALPVDHYVDDFIVPDIAVVAEIGQACLKQVADRLGLS
jgi:hypothetical protein